MSTPTPANVKTSMNVYQVPTTVLSSATILLAVTSARAEMAIDSTPTGDPVTMLTSVLTIRLTASSNASTQRAGTTVAVRSATHWKLTVLVYSRNQ